MRRQMVTTMYNNNNYFTTLWLGEGQEVHSVTFHQLRKNVTVLASALKNLGIKKGDRVVGMNCIW